MNKNANVRIAGTLDVRAVRAMKAPWIRRFKNHLLPGHMKGLVAYLASRSLGPTVGLVSVIGELRMRTLHLPGQVYFEWLARKKAGVPQDELDAFRMLYGKHVDYGVVSYRVITDAGVAYMVDDFDNASGGADISLFNFHGCGTGSTAESAADTTLVSEITTQITPDSTRATGTRSQPAANQYRSTGTVNFDGSVTVQEHGFFNQAGTGGGILWDRTVHGSQAMGSGESIQYQYTLTVNSGG